MDHTTSGGRRPPRACLLARKSNTPGEDNLSLEVQREEGLKYIARQGWVCDPATDVVTHVVSGWQKQVNRSRIAELVDSTTTGRYDVIVMYKIDRFGRRVPEVTYYFERMAEHGVRLASVTENQIFDLSNPTQLMFATFLVVGAQWESSNTSTRVRGARAHKRELGHWQGGVPFGWDIDCDIAPGGDRIYQRAENGSKRLRRKPGQAEIVDRILALARDHLLSPGGIARRLNSQNIPSPAGKAWTDKQVRRVLVNPVLAGCTPEWDHDPDTRRPVAWSVHPLRDSEGQPVIIHEPAISFADYEVLFAKHGPRTVSTRQRAGRALLTGLLFCASHPADQPDLTCRGRLTGSSQPGPNHKYHCPHEDDPRRCRGNTVTQQPIEQYIVQFFLSQLGNTDLAERHAQVVAAGRNHEASRESQLQSEIARLTELAEAHKNAAANATTAAAIATATENFDQTVARIERLRRELPDTPPTAPLDRFSQKTLAERTQEFLAANRDQQRGWLASLIDRIELLPAQNRGVVKGAFGSRGFDPRRVRIYQRHDPTRAITPPNSWQPPTPDHGGPTPCPDCGRELRNRPALASHQRWAHGRVSKAKQARGQRATEFPCRQPRCDKVLYNAAALRNHLWHAHKVTQGYPCTEPGCDRVFQLPAGLGRHLTTIHSGRREFCVLCGQATKAGGLWLHQKRAHAQ